MSTEIEPETVHAGDVVREELYALAERNEGRIEPGDVVEAARDESSQLHRLFTWDDSEAARRYRLLQAATLIRRIKITVLRRDQETREVRIEAARAIESPATERNAKGEPPKGGSYMRVAKIAKDPKLRAAMVDTVLSELGAIRKRYARLTELETVWTAIDEATEE